MSPGHKAIPSSLLLCGISFLNINSLSLAVTGLSVLPLSYKDSHRQRSATSSLGITLKAGETSLHLEWLLTPSIALCSFLDLSFSHLPSSPSSQAPTTLKVPLSDSWGATLPSSLSIPLPCGFHSFSFFSASSDHTLFYFFKIIPFLGCLIL